MNNEQIFFGIEMEAIFKSPFLIDKGEYHNPEHFWGCWNVEEDGSLELFYNEEFSDTGEFTSQILEGKEEVIKAIKSLSEYLRENDIHFFFNTFCGCHIHFSLKDRDIRNYVINKKEAIKKMEKIFFSLLRKEKNIPIAVKKAIKNHYYREYAESYINGKYSSLNFRPRFPTIEWRSFNLLGLSLPEDEEIILKLFEIATQSIETFIKKVVFQKEDYIFDPQIDFENYLYTIII